MRLSKLGLSLPVTVAVMHAILSALSPSRSRRVVKWGLLAAYED